MDLNSLLNTLKEEKLSFEDICKLRASLDSTLIVEKIRTFTSFQFPTDKSESFVFFDTFIQLLLVINLEDDPYGAQYTQSLMMESFQKCITGLSIQFGNGWLIEFPFHLTSKTWCALRKHKDPTILVCLYGLVLTFSREATSHAWIKALIQFIKSNYAGIIINLWLTCCCTFDEEDAQNLFMDTLESQLQKEYASTKVVADQLIQVLSTCDLEYLNTTMGRYMGAGRAIFTKEDYTLGYMQLECKLSKGAGTLTHLKKLYRNYTMKSGNPWMHNNSTDFIYFTHSKYLATNPLLDATLLENWTTDKHKQIVSIQKGTLLWMQNMRDMVPTEFDVHLKSLILEHYPTDRKIVLDSLLADWTVRDIFQCHLDQVADTLIDLLSTKPYNKRCAPFYAFIQLFNIPDENHQQQHTNNETEMYHYETKSGAFIDLSQFSNCSDPPLMLGCSRLLQSLTKTKANQRVRDWVGDCLHNASSDIIKNYFSWLAHGLNDDVSLKKDQTPFALFLKVALNSCHTQSAHIVPILLQSFTFESLEWLVRYNRNSAESTLVHYFDDGPQVSKNIMIQELFSTKSKRYMDLLLGFLREKMQGTDPKLPHSRAWFRNHFLGVILSFVGKDTKSQDVASCILRELFKAREKFEWYFGTALVQSENQLDFKSLHLSNNHEVYTIKESGLAYVFHEMVKLGQADQKKHLLKVWFDLWTSQSKITVPVSWILQCAGLYDQAPVLVKQMIKQWITIGLLEENTTDQNARSFVSRFMDLVLISDAPEPESLFELMLEVAISHRSFPLKEVNDCIIHILIDLSEELDFETEQLSLTPTAPETIKETAQEPEAIVINTTNPWKAARLRRRIEKANAREKSRKKLITAVKKEVPQPTSNTNAKDNASLTTIKTLLILVQRVFDFLLRLLNSTSRDLSIKQDIRQELINTPLIYEPLAKFARLVQKPDDLREDVQNVIVLCLDYLKKQPDPTVYNISQRILVV